MMPERGCRRQSGAGCRIHLIARPTAITVPSVSARAIAIFMTAPFVLVPITVSTVAKAPVADTLYVKTRIPHSIAVGTKPPEHMIKPLFCAVRLGAAIFPMLSLHR
jgi:hypothetical protein